MFIPRCDARVWAASVRIINPSDRYESTRGGEKKNFSVTRRCLCKIFRFVQSNERQMSLLLALKEPEFMKNIRILIHRAVNKLLLRLAKATALRTQLNALRENPVSFPSRHQKWKSALIIGLLAGPHRSRAYQSFMRLRSQTALLFSLISSLLPSSICHLTLLTTNAQSE